jgi:hypothetical protein
MIWIVPESLSGGPALRGSDTISRAIQQREKLMVAHSSKGAIFPHARHRDVLRLFCLRLTLDTFIERHGPGVSDTWTLNTVHSCAVMTLQRRRLCQIVDGKQAKIVKLTKMAPGL